jgi:acyl carrier protein
MTDEKAATAVRVSQGILVLAADVLGIEGTGQQAGDGALDRDLFEEGLRIGGQEIDSLDLVEVLAIIESDLNLNIFDIDDTDGLRTLRGIGDYIATEAEPALVDEFVSRWAG